MPTTCTFKLDRISPIYNSGEYIKGQIILNTKKNKRINAVYISLEGEAKVRWSITGKEITNYYGHQQYLYTRANVSSERDFTAGIHTYNISLLIPQNCPSSCSGPYGHIAYYMSLVLDKSHTFNEIFRQPIYVVQTLDLNINPDYAVPVRGENVKYLCQWPCQSGPIFFYLMLPFSGFTAGQYINYMLEIDNQSPHYDIWAVEASLKQHFVFLARMPLKRNFHTKTLNTVSIDEQTLRLSKRLYQGTIMVPQRTPRSTLNTNYIVFLHYTLQVKLKTGFLHYDATITVPVIIGTTPIRHLLDDSLAFQNTINFEETSRHLITSQPTLRLYEELNRILYEQPEYQQRSSGSPGNSNNDEIDEKPPSYDSFLPPSFSYATLDSEEAMDDNSKLISAKVPKIQMSRFRDYNTFTTTTSNACSIQTSNPLLNSSAYGSLPTIDILSEMARESISNSGALRSPEENLNHTFSDEND